MLPNKISKNFNGLYLGLIKFYFYFLRRSENLDSFKAEQRLLNNRVINDHRLVSNVFQAQYPYYTRYMNRRGLIDIYDNLWSPQGRMY